MRLRRAGGDPGGGALLESHTRCRDAQGVGRLLIILLLTIPAGVSSHICYLT